MNRLHLTTLLSAALLAACGGGANKPADTVTLTGRAVDGALQGAVACYDLDDDLICGATEPRSLPSGADGSFTLEVPPAAAGRHATVVDVPADAIDADTGTAVGQAFVLRAPATGTAAAHAVFASPLSTLVQAHMAATGRSKAEAEALVREQAGLAISPLADFTADGSDAGRHAARVARLVQLTANEQTQALADVVGTADRNGSRVTAVDLDREVSGVLLAALPAIAGAAIDPAVLAADGSRLQALLFVQARALAAQLGLTADQVRAAATVQRLAEPPLPNPPVATGTVTAFRYTNSGDWYYRSLRGSAADNVPDASGFVRFHDVRVASPAAAASAAAPSVVKSWSFGNVQARAGDLHWDGVGWSGCALTDRYPSRLRDAQGRSDYNYCNNSSAGTTVRRLEDISGQAIQAVVRDKIRTFPGGANGVLFSNWGPANLTLYGSATFPAGSYLIYQTDTTTSTAFAYEVNTSNQVVVYSAAVAAGGDTRSVAGLACADNQQNVVTNPAVTLEQMVARMPARPCVFNQGGTAPNQTLSPDEWWGNSTVNMGDLTGFNTLPAGTGTVYSTTASLRVGFAASGNRATFYRCYRRANNNSPRNCTVIGLGTWAIQTLGDGRVLSFSTMPAIAQRLGYSRVFVERNGRIYFGYRDPVGAAAAGLRLNLTAANAVFEKLGLPRVRPVTQPGTATGTRAATLALLQGAWGGATSTTTASIFRFGPDGRFFLAEAKPFTSVTNEQSGAELGWFDHDAATGRISTLLEVDSNLTSGTSHPKDTDPPITITATAISNGSGSITRLQDVPSGLVGLWALDSATDLSVTHLAFFANGRLMLVQHRANAFAICATAAGQCPEGVEFSEYSFNPTTGDMTAFGLQYDTNGCNGLFNNCPAAVANGTVNTTRTLNFTFGAGNQTIAFTDPEGNARTLYRIAPQ